MCWRGIGGVDIDECDRDKCGPPDGSERTLAILAGGVKWWAKTAKQEGDGISKSSIPDTRYSLFGEKKNMYVTRARTLVPCLYQTWEWRSVSKRDARSYDEIKSINEASNI